MTHPWRGYAKAACEVFPELRGTLAENASKEDCLIAMSEYVQRMRDVQMVDTEEMPTGIDAAFRALLPEPIYIPAVHDLADDIKTKDGASFGKLLGLVLEQISDDAQTKQISEFFGLLDNLLNPSENRLKQLVRLESQLDALLKEQFSRAKVSFRFPMPNLKSLVEGAIIDVDDGLKGEARTKGDGLRRALTFALIRALVQTQLSRNEQDDPHRDRYVFLFEALPQKQWA